MVTCPRYTKREVPVAKKLNLGLIRPKCFWKTYCIFMPTVAGLGYFPLFEKASLFDTSPTVQTYEGRRLSLLNRSSCSSFGDAAGLASPLSSHILSSLCPRINLMLWNLFSFLLTDVFQQWGCFHALWALCKLKTLTQEAWKQWLNQSISLSVSTLMQPAWPDRFVGLYRLKVTSKVGRCFQVLFQVCPDLLFQGNYC